MIDKGIKYLRDGRAPIPLNESTSKVMSSNKGKNTKPELFFRKTLWHNNIRGYRLHLKKVHGTPDISFPGDKIAIFINGCFWHRCPYCQLQLPKSNKEFWKKKFDGNIKRDKRKFDLLEKEEWKVIVIWECQLKNDLQNYVEMLKSLIIKNV
jgi:DNA mismatch endonuclease (patch repair protein)